MRSICTSIASLHKGPCAVAPLEIQEVRATKIHEKGAIEGESIEIGGYLTHTILALSEASGALRCDNPTRDLFGTMEGITQAEIDTACHEQIIHDGIHKFPQ